MTLGINPHIRWRIEAIDAAVPVDMRPEQRARGGVAFHSEKVVVEIRVVAIRIARPMMNMAIGALVHGRTGD